MNVELCYIIAIVILSILLFIMVALFALHCAKIKREIKRVNMEIERTTGRERQAWQRVKKHLMKAVFFRR